MRDHKISLATATLLTMNILIGSGILIGPGKIASISGNASFLAWPLVAMVFLPLVLSTAELSNMFPGCGGFYNYATQGLNKTAGFISGWMYIVGYTFAIAVDIIAIREVFITSGIHNPITTSPLIFGILFLAICAFLNIINLKYLTGILNSLTIAKILPLVILILLLPFMFNTSFVIATPELALLPSSLPLAIFGFFGFEYCCSMTHLIKDSKTNAPRAIFAGFMITAILYTLFHFGLLNLMGADNLAKYGASSFAQFINLPIPFLKEFLMLLIPLASILTIFAGANGMLNANSILLNSMAQEKLFVLNSFPAKLNRIGRPYLSVILVCLVALLITLIFPDLSTVGNLCNLAITSSFILPFTSLLVIKRKNIDKTHWALASLMVSCGLAFYSWYLLGNSFTSRVINSWPIVTILIIGYILFLIQNNLAKKYA